MNFRGTSVEQSAFADKHKKLLKTIAGPAEYDVKVDIQKVSMDVIRPWIAKKIDQLMGFEDDVLSNLVVNLLQEGAQPDPRNIQVQLTAFLEGNAPKFVLELWTLLIDAQNNGGIPKVFLERAKDELASANRSGWRNNDTNNDVKDVRESRETSSSRLAHRQKAEQSSSRSSHRHRPYERRRSRSRSRDRRRSRSRSRDRRRSRSRSRDRHRRRRSRSRSRDRHRSRRSRRDRSRSRSRSRSNDRRRSDRSDGRKDRERESRTSEGARPTIASTSGWVSASSSDEE